MKREYLCPHCDGRLSPGVKIILRAERRGRHALFLFSPRPGNYSVIIPPGFIVQKGQSVRFSCPACARDLTSKRDASMAEIRFVGAHGESGTVAFSREHGHHETYFVTKEQVKSYGEDAVDDSVNFWGVGPGR